MKPIFNFKIKFKKLKYLSCYIYSYLEILNCSFLILNAKLFITTLSIFLILNKYCKHLQPIVQTNKFPKTKTRTFSLITETENEKKTTLSAT